MSFPSAEQDFGEVYHNIEQKRFEIRLGDEFAELTYELQGENTLVLLHTGVPPAWEGRGIGSRLVKAALEYAREHHYQIVPVCSFVVAYLRRHPEYHLLVKGSS